MRVFDPGHHSVFAWHRSHPRFGDLVGLANVGTETVDVDAARRQQLRTPSICSPPTTCDRGGWNRSACGGSPPTPPTRPHRSHPSADRHDPRPRHHRRRGTRPRVAAPIWSTRSCRRRRPTSQWWPSRWIGRSLFVSVRTMVRRLPEESRLRESALTVFGPVLLIVLLFAWCLLQVIGFGLIWWGMGDIPTIHGLGDAWSTSPASCSSRSASARSCPSRSCRGSGAVTEAFFGVITVALVIGYLPSLYAAYSDRERALMTLDAGSSDRITPTALIMAWAPDADPRRSTPSSSGGRSGRRASSRPIRPCRCSACSARTTASRTGSPHSACCATPRSRRRSSWARPTATPTGSSVAPRRSSGR